MSAPRKGLGALYYPPDGKGRDSYIIQGNGTVRNYSIGFVDYPNTYIRNNKYYPYQTPMMDSFHQRNSMKQPGVWPSKRSRVLNSKIKSVMK